MAGLGAGTNNPFGFSAYSNVDGPVNYAQTERKIKSSQTTAIFFGDLLEEDGSNAGYITQWASGGGPAVGVFVGCRYLSLSQKKYIWNNYWPGSDANGDVTAFVINDPLSLFLVQAGSSNIPFADIGSLCGPAATPSGNTTTGLSGMFIQAVTGTPGANLPFVIVAVPGSESPASQTVPDPTQPYNWLVVGWNASQSAVNFRPA